MGRKGTGGQGFYAVQDGRSTGVFTSWDECNAQVAGYSGAVFRRFDTAAEAQAFSRGHSNHQPAPVSAPHYYAPPTPPRQQPQPQYHAAPVSVKRSYDDADYDQQGSLSPSIPAKRHNTGAQASSSAQPASATITTSSSAKQVVYCDGAAKGNGRTGAVAGVGVFFGHGDARNLSEPLNGPLQTNQRAEATAALRALQAVPKSTPIEIRTDSSYVVNAMNSWTKKWVQNDYRGVDGKEVKNRDLFEQLTSAVAGRSADTSFVHVPGHAGIEGNEAADKLANQGVALKRR